MDVPGSMRVKTKLAVSVPELMASAHPVAKRPLLLTVLICCVAQNCAMGLAFGSFGPLVTANELRFHVSRAVVSTGMSALLFGLAGLSPVLGGILQRNSIRNVMIVGTALSALAYWGLAVLTSFGGALVMYGLIGIGVCLVAILGPLSLISRWFSSDRARMLGIVNLPIVLFLTPAAVGALLSSYSREAILAGIGVIFLLLLPLLFFLVDQPEQTAQLPAHIGGPYTGPDVGNLEEIPLQPTRAMLSNPAFWFISIAVGIMAGSSTAFVVHAIPFSMGKLMSLREGSTLLSVHAVAGIFGNLLLGWIADRVGPPMTLILTSLCQALLWFGMLHVGASELYVLAAVLGICLIPLVTLHGAVLSELFGATNISRAMGFSYAVKLPFLLAFAPVAGLLFERSGNYELPFLATAGSLVIAGVFLVFAQIAMRKQR
jgi:MFS family permease